MYAAGPSSAAVVTGAQADLWRVLWARVGLRATPPVIRWVKAHALEHPVFVDQYQLAYEDVLGNAYADVLADFAAERAAIP